MQKRGRPSAGDQASAGAKAKIEAAKVIPGGFGTRAEPPADMDPEQADIWRQTVASEPASFFATAATKGMLRNYCRHMATVDKISSVIEMFQADWLKAKDGVKRYSELCRLRDLEARAAADKAVKLRLTNQARWTPAKAGTAGRNEATSEKKPWEI